MALVTLVPPTAEPVTLAQMKLFARVDFPDDDTLFPSFIAASREWCEVFCKRRFRLRTLRLLMDFFPGYIDTKLAGSKVSSPFVSGSNALLASIRWAIALPEPKVRGIVQLNYLDANGNLTAIPLTPARLGGPFIYDIDSEPARIAPNAQTGQMWPVAMVTINAIAVDYITGYGGNITIGVTQGQTTISGYVFNPGMVGLSLTVPGAGGASGGAGMQPLITKLASVDTNGVGTMADAAAVTVPSAFAYLGQPVPDAIQVAIMRLANYYYDNRTTMDKAFLDSIKQQLSPYRDLRL